MDSNCMAKYKRKLSSFSNGSTFSFLQMKPLCCSSLWYTFPQLTTKPSIFHGIASFSVIKFHIYIVLQKSFDLLFKYLTVPIEPLINLSETLILSLNITLVPTQNFNFAGRLAVWEGPILSGIDMEHVFVSMSLLPSWALITKTSESSLPIQSSFSWLYK